MGLGTPETVTAYDVFRRFIELHQLVPDLNDWHEDRLERNEPRIIRLKQLTAIFAAFEIPWDPWAFTRGQFIEGKNPAYSDFVARTKRELPSEHVARLRPGWYFADLPGCFEILFEYREKLEDVLSFPERALIASGMYLYAQRQIEKANRAIESNVWIIDDLLAELISPESRQFAVTELVHDHGYPDVDIFEIDSEYF